MREPFGFRQPGRKSARLREKCAREEMPADVPGMFCTWAGRAHAVIDSQHRRRTKMQGDQTGKAGEEGTNGKSPQQQPKPKREWWRLDQRTAEKYRPVEPPAVADPSVYPTRERIIFGWEARMSPLEEVLQDEVRRLLPQLHEWIVRRAVHRAGLHAPGEEPEPDVPPVADFDPDAKPPQENTEPNL